MELVLVVQIQYLSLSGGGHDHTQNIKQWKLVIGERKYSWQFIQWSQSSSGKWKQFICCHIHTPFLPPQTHHWNPWCRSNILMYWLHNIKIKQDFISLLLITLLLTTLQVGLPWTITTITRSIPLVLLVVSGYDGCLQIIHIWYNILLSEPFWNIYCWPLRLIPTRTISVGLKVPVEMSSIATPVISQAWPGRWPSTRAISISTVKDSKVNLLKIFFDWLLNCHNVILWEKSMVLTIII